VARYKGQPVLVDFWATWCGPCRMAMKTIEPLKKELWGKCAFVYVTSPTSPQATWSKMVPGIHGDHFYVSEKQWGTLMKQFQVQGIPAYIVVDSKGKGHPWQGDKYGTSAGQSDSRSARRTSTFLAVCRHIESTGVACSASASRVEGFGGAKPKAGQCTEMTIWQAICLLLSEVLTEQGLPAIPGRRCVSFRPLLPVGTQIATQQSESRKPKGEETN